MLMVWWKTVEDEEHSVRTRSVIGAYMQAKYEADADLVRRTAFQWTIFRPGGLSNEPGTGTGAIGKAHLKRQISVCWVFTVLHVRVG